MLLRCKNGPASLARGCQEALASAESDCGDQGPMVVGMGARRATTSLRERSLGTLGRSIYAQPERGFLEIAALRPTASQSRPLASPCWSGRHPATRSAENDQVRSLLALEPLDESLSGGPPAHR